MATSHKYHLHPDTCKADELITPPPLLSVYPYLNLVCNWFTVMITSYLLFSALYRIGKGAAMFSSKGPEYVLQAFLKELEGKFVRSSSNSNEIGILLIDVV